MVYFVCAGHICSGLSQSEFYLHVLMTTMHTGTGPASAAPSTQRISGQETLTAGCVGRAVGHGYGSHAFRCPHIEDSLQEQRNRRMRIWQISQVSERRCSNLWDAVVLYTSLPAPAWRLVLPSSSLRLTFDLFIFWVRVKNIWMWTGCFVCWSVNELCSLPWRWRGPRFGPSEAGRRAESPQWPKDPDQAKPLCGEIQTLGQ